MAGLLRRLRRGRQPDQAAVNYHEQDVDPPYGYNLLQGEPTYAEIARNNVSAQAPVVQLTQFNGAPNVSKKAIANIFGEVQSSLLRIASFLLEKIDWFSREKTRE